MYCYSNIYFYLYIYIYKCIYKNLYIFIWMYMWKHWKGRKFSSSRFMRIIPSPLIRCPSCAEMLFLFSQFCLFVFFLAMVRTKRRIERGREIRGKERKGKEKKKGGAKRWFSRQTDQGSDHHLHWSPLICPLSPRICTEKVSGTIFLELHFYLS